MEPFFSVIIPVYNSEKYIDECVKSVLGQHCRDFELILVDDGSPDNCPQICDKYSETDSRVRVIHKENGGHTSARRAGLEISSGKYILMVDSDDYIDATMLEAMREVINRDCADIVCCDLMKFSEGGMLPFDESFSCGRFSGKSPDDIREIAIYDKEKSFYAFGVTPSLIVKAIKRDLYLSVFSEMDEKIRVGEDLAITILCMIKTDKISFLDKALYYYRLTEGSVSRRFDAHAFLDLKRLSDFLRAKTDVEKFDMDNQINVFVAYRFSSILSSMCSGIGSKEFRMLMRTPEVVSLHNDLKRARVRIIEKKDKVKMFMIRHKLYGCFRLINKIIGNKGK